MILLFQKAPLYGLKSALEKCNTLQPWCVFGKFVSKEIQFHYHIDHNALSKKWNNISQALGFVERRFGRPPFFVD